MAVEGSPIGQIEFASLKMVKYRTFTVKLCITNDDRAKIRAGLRQHGVLGDTWTTNAIEPVITVSARPEFVEAQMAIMPEDDEKTTVEALLQDDKFPFAYDVRDNVTSPGGFPNPGFDIDAFKARYKSCGGDAGPR